MVAGHPVVSVAMKAYNHAPYVAQAIRSVLDQTFADFELLITDDASTDATPEIIASFTDERIRFERFTTNRGISAAMSATVARARGEFVAILNSDDYAFPERLAKQVALLRERADVGAVFSLPQLVGEAGEPLHGLGPAFGNPFAESDAPREQWLRYFFLQGNCLCAPSAMIRRSVYEELGPDDPRLALLLDLDRWIRLLERHEIYVMKEPLTAFRVRANCANASADTHVTHLRDTFESFQIAKRYRGFAPDFLRTIFAQDISLYEIDTSGPTGVWLAELALRGLRPWQPLFALDTLFEAAETPDHFRRLRELVATVDAFGGVAAREIAGAGV